MGLFDQVVNALNNPNQQASPDQLSTVLGTISHLSGRQGMDAATTQALVSVVGQHVRTALKNKQSGAGPDEAEMVVNRFSSTEASPEAVQSLFSPTEQANTVQDAANRTGLDAQTIQTLLPILIPIVLQFLKSGAPTQPGQGSNSVLAAFLDSDQDGDTDLGDAISVASRFLQNR